MMYVRFDGHVRRENMYPGVENSKGVSFDIATHGDDQAVCHALIDVMALNKDENYSKIGELEFYSYSVNRCNLELDEEDFEDFDCENILCALMDSENEDTANYYEVLQTLYPRIRAEDEDIIWGDDVHIIALQRFFIEPEYRGMGIGKFIAENLAKVIFEATNIKSLYCVGVLVPDDGTSATREIQRKTMESADFCVVEDWDAEYIFGKCIYDEDIM